MDIQSKILSKVTKNRLKAEINPITIENPTYFYLSPEDKLDFVTQRLQFMKQSFLDLLEITDFLPINHISSKSFYTFGMITSITGSKIDSDCMIFNPSDKSSVLSKLNLNSVDSYSLFKGQVVAIKGKNPRGDEISVESIYTLPVVNINTSKRQSLRCTVSKGPFTQSIIKQILENDPEVLILFGPFNEDNESDFANFEELLQFLESQLKKTPVSKAIIVPSLEDTQFLRIIPQLAKPYAFQRIICVSNPSFIYINNHLVSLCNYDLIHELSSEEIYKEKKSDNDLLFSGDRVTRLSYHLVFQRSFAPVFPSNINVALGEWLNMKNSPDLYICSSKMIQFSKEVGPTTVVNIGFTSGKTVKIESHGTETKYNIKMG